MNNQTIITSKGIQTISKKTEVILSNTTSCLNLTLSRPCKIYLNDDSDYFLLTDRIPVLNTSINYDLSGAQIYKITIEPLDSSSVSYSYFGINTHYLG